MKKILFALLAATMLIGCQEKKDDNVIKIGAILPLTGTIGSAGIDSKNGLELAIAKANTMLTTYNYQLEIVYEDHKSSAKDAVAAINKLITTDQIDLVYCQLTNTSLAIKPIVTAKKIPTFAVSGAIDLLENSQYVYRNYINPYYYAEETLKCISQLSSNANMCVIYSNTDFGISMFDGLQKASHSSNINISNSYAYDDTSSDYKSLIYKVLNENPEVKTIYVAGVGRNLGMIIKQLKQLGFQGNIIGGIELPYDEVIGAIGENHSNIYYIDFAFTPNDIDNEISKTFTEEYILAYGETPNTSAALAYDAIMVITNVIQNKGNFTDIDMVTKGVTGSITVKEHEVYHELKLKKMGQ